MSDDLVQRLRAPFTMSLFFNKSDMATELLLQRRDAADRIERQRTLISDMMTVLMNRLDDKDPKVKALLLRGIEEMPETDFIPE